VILFEDISFLAIDKPSGLRVIPDGYDPSLPTVLTLLQPDWGKLMVVHRLDKDTSGVMLLARHPEAHRLLSKQFAEHRVKKTYLALCLGLPDWDEIQIDFPLRIDGDRRHRTVYDAVSGKSASTAARLVKKFQTFCLVEARPLTGYTHQIRAHLALAGLPLLGDPLYSYPPSWSGLRLDPSSGPSFSRTALHARSITFAHPVSGEQLVISAPAPQDLSPYIGE
jgi:RluA family pseudouridine synthase